MPHPRIEPYASGLLTVDDGDQIYWETSGNPDGKPVLHLHGGPGSGLGRGGYRRNFDPERHLIIGIDQRGCGRSRPRAIEALDRLHLNTTQRLIRDLEAVRQHLQVDSWLVTGVSWGSTLALAYALAVPARVTQLALVAVTTTSREETQWITEGVGRIFPEAWDRFDRASGRRGGERVVEAYARRLAGADPADRAQAALDWDEWESTHISLDPLWTPDQRRPDPVQRETFATLVTHYWANDAFLSGDAAIRRRVSEIGHIPAVLIHGRHDVSGPAITPWQLHQQWPASRLMIVESEGHGGPESMEQLRLAVDAWSATTQP
ncbi:prolyl aminopeptidase [Microlunatus capsulatus]|uniref:Proline iminopeptidase n=1 Tax=Microlunatus capsulatus TaxID=99117 RepID=A0ABS4ZCY6_9ACTN|nr:prolyl aminopeptidase [Microlunatus capsulatus]MBP2418906.1 proline iminopeptidase [Microlunatus capsulatus]